MIQLKLQFIPIVNLDRTKTMNRYFLSNELDQVSKQYFYDELLALAKKSIQHDSIETNSMMILINVLYT